MSAALEHRPASQVDASWLGRQVIVGRFSGGLSDVEQDPTHHRTDLWVGGNHIEVHSDTTVTSGSTEFLGGSL